MGETIETARGAAGRPTIEDELEVVLFVEAGKRRRDLNVREFCRLRTTRYIGRLVHLDEEGCPVLKGARMKMLAGDALRRRYTQARRRLGLMEPTENEFGEPCIGATAMHDTVERLIEEYMRPAA